MRRRNRSGGFASAFTLVVSIVGAFVGVIVGYSLDDHVQSRRLLAFLAAAAAVLVVTFGRHILASIPALSIAGGRNEIRPFLWFSIVLSSILGALAGHDLCELYSLSAGWIIGLSSGILASLSMALIMVVYFHEHPEKGVEF